MANNKKLRVTEFDFDDVKSNLKTFLKNQTEFTDMILKVLECPLC